jgi:CheY-like chemotaxis protein
MNFTVVDKNAEDMLYALLIAEEQGVTGKNQKTPRIRFLQCQFFHIAMSASLADVREFLNEMSGVKDCTLYFCSDGDIIIRWSGGNDDVRDKLVTSITEKFGSDINKYMNPEDFFVDYDLLDGPGKLKAECAKKLKKQTKQSKILAHYFSDDRLVLTLHKTVQLTKMQRVFRPQPHILIVEDQIFSQKVLTSILKDYTCHVAEGSGEALLLYMEKCPDIVFLDIELPDLNGHAFARLINKIDDDAYIVMVTGNQYQEDIKTARENKVKGYIAKPYEKDSILRTIAQYQRSKKKDVA